MKMLKERLMTQYQPISFFLANLSPSEYQIVLAHARMYKTGMSAILDALALQFIEDLTCGEQSEFNLAIAAAKDAKAKTITLAVPIKDQKDVQMVLPYEDRNTLIKAAKQFRTTKERIVRALVRQRLSSTWHDPERVKEKILHTYQVEQAMFS